MLRGGRPEGRVYVRSGHASHRVNGRGPAEHFSGEMIFADPAPPSPLHLRDAGDAASQREADFSSRLARRTRCARPPAALDQRGEWFSAIAAEQRAFLPVRSEIAARSRAEAVGN